jgi:hypothetical protein
MKGFCAIWNKIKSYTDIIPLHTIGDIQVSEPVVAEPSFEDLF